MVFPSYVLDAIQQLNAAGYEGYAVGGCVRDSLLGKAPHDWDLATSAKPEQVKAVFAGCRVLETGIQHGTVTLLTDGGPLEITTYRIDGVYSDGRRPDSVAFTGSLKEDLARRDFTVNAMACHPEEGLVDCFGGREDLRNGVIRCVGDPDKRFSEDALRLMRALRFSSVLGFSIHPDTAESLLRCREALAHIAAERILSELLKLLCGKDVFRVLMEYPQLLWVFLPELQPMRHFDQHTPYHLYDVWEHTARAVAAAPPEPALRLAMLFHDAGKPASFTRDAAGQGHFKGHAAVSETLAKKMLARLKASNELKERVLMLVRCHDDSIPAERKAVRRALGRFGAEGFFALLQAKRADDAAKNPEFSRSAQIDALETLAKELLDEGACFSLKDLAVTGSDLLAAGCPAGPEVGRVLKMLLEQVMEERCSNQRDELLEKAAQLLATNNFAG